MNRVKSVIEKQAVALRACMGLLILLAVALPLLAKVEVDFDPNLNFSDFKTYAYFGGVEHLVMMQLNPKLISDRVHRAVQRQMGKKGLREVQPNENPDLVVRYWANSQTHLNVAATGNWGPLWALSGHLLGVYVRHDERIEHAGGHAGAGPDRCENKELAWRLYLIRKIVNVDKDWKKADQDFSKGFESYPPSAKQIEDKKKERASEKPKPESML